MTHGWLNHLGRGRLEVASAGIQPKRLHPMAVKVMDAVGIDI